MGIGTLPCGTCSHLRAIHPHGAACLTAGCDCAAFVPTAPALDQAHEQEETRRVCIDVPDGYMVSVSLVPYTEGS